MTEILPDTQVDIPEYPMERSAACPSRRRPA